MKRFLDSERLYLRELTKNDHQLLYRLNGDPEVMEFIRTPDSLDQAKESLERYISFYDGNGLGIWAAHQIKDDKFVGLYIFRKYEQTDDVEIGYRLHKDFWGKGYATEMTKVLIDYAFDVLELKELFAVALPDNKSSAKVLKKCGFRNVGTTDKYYDATLNYYKIIQ